MPEHYKQYAFGTKKYKKAYAQHLMQKLNKKRVAGYGDQAMGGAPSG